MPIRTVPGSNLRYYFIAYDADGRERTDDPAGQMSQRAVEALNDEPITDVFIFSHGWQGDVQGAIPQYDAWTAMMAASPDLDRARRERPGFTPLLVGLHWPSQPWGDESLDGSFAIGSGSGQPIARQIEQYAARLGDTPETRAALQTIFDAALAEIAPPTLPPRVREAYEILDREAGLGSSGPAAPPGADRERFDPESVYQAAEEEAAISFAPGWLGGLLAPLRLLSFWKMKDRGRHVGETGGSELLAALQGAVGSARDARFHLMGHSFGCIVVSAMVAGPGGHGRLVRPVDSVVLVQGALSLWSYCTSIPPAPGQSGYFRSIVEGKKVRGPILTTRTDFDHAVGRFYPLGAGARRQVSFDPNDFPKYGAVGTFGLRGPGPDLVNRILLPASESYGFQPGKIYNLECDAIIRAGGGVQGAHGDFLHPEVAHAVWEAALV